METAGDSRRMYSQDRWIHVGRTKEFSHAAPQPHFVRACDPFVDVDSGRATRPVRRRMTMRLPLSEINSGFDALEQGNVARALVVFDG